METTREIRDFLVSRRAKVSPERAGVPRYGKQRRVAGLRREDVALLAGISVEYYTRLERGSARGVSSDVLDAVASALLLDEAEREHLYDLVRANAEHRPRGVAAQREVRPSIRRIVDALGDVAAFVMNGRLDVLYANDLAEVLFHDVFRDVVRPPNFARFIYLDPRSRSFYLDWDTVAHDIAAMLRGEAGRTPSDRALSDLVGQLSTRSEDFRVLWASHDVRFHRTGVKAFRHGLVGDLSLTFDSIPLPADPGLSLVTYSAEAGTRSADAMGELAGWAATRAAMAATRAAPTSS